MKENKGNLFIISAPSGTGKTTLVKKLCERLDNLFVSISYTTRPKRKDEIEGIAYFFIDEETFLQMIKENQFLEYARVFDYYYGTSNKWVTSQLQKGHDIILEIDWQGAQHIRNKIGNTSIFILPPTFATLEQRLRKRASDDEITIQRRCRDAYEELSHFNEFDYLIKNDDLDTALDDLCRIIESVRNESPLSAGNLYQFANQLMTEGSDLE